MTETLLFPRGNAYRLISPEYKAESWQPCLTEHPGPMVLEVQLKFLIQTQQSVKMFYYG